MSADQLTLKDLLNSQRESRKSRRTKSEAGSTIMHFGRAILLLLLLVAPWCFGSVHLASQTFLLGGMTLVVSTWWLDFVFNGNGRTRFRLVPFVLIPVVLGWVLALAQVVPLPTNVAAWLAPGQQRVYQEYAAEPLTAEDSATDASSVTTISLDRDQTRRQAGMLVLAAACVLVSVHFFRSTNGLLSLCWVMAINGALISSVGIYERLGGATDKVLGVYTPLYAGSFFGPYVNRNNAAGLLLICLGCSLCLTYLLLQHRKSRRPVPIISKEIPLWRQFHQSMADFFSELTAVKLVALVLMVVNGIGLLATLSRGGVIAGLAAAMTTTILFGFSQKPKGSLTLFVLVLVITLGGASYFGFGEKLRQRLDQFADQEITDISRVQNWQDTFPAVSEFGPAGSGLGAYHAVHRIFRSDREVKIYEYAENQYYQSLIDGGWIGAGLLLSALLVTVWCIFQLLRSGQSNVSLAAGLLGLFVLSAVGVASIFDFGLYLPANMLAMAAVVGAVCGNAHWQAQRSARKSPLAYQGTIGISQVLALAIFAGLLFNSMYFYRLSEIDRLLWGIGIKKTIPMWTLLRLTC